MTRLLPCAGKVSFTSLPFLPCIRFFFFFFFFFQLPFHRQGLSGFFDPVGLSFISSFSSGCLLSSLYANESKPESELSAQRSVCFSIRNFFFSLSSRLYLASRPKSRVLASLNFDYFYLTPSNELSNEQYEKLQRRTRPLQHF